MRLYEISFPYMYYERVERRSFLLQHTECPNKKQIRKAIAKLCRDTDPEYKDVEIYRFILDDIIPNVQEWPMIEQGSGIDARASISDFPEVGRQSVVISEVHPLPVE